jgi:predicted nucleotidyltransferase component of viral defense system
MGWKGRILTLHLDALTKDLQSVLREMGSFMSERGFYLGGGTALAVYLGHRLSVDLDWFSEKPLPDPLIFARELKDKGIPFIVNQTDRGTLHGSVHGVNVSILEYRYPLLAPANEWSEFHCLLATLEDLTCMKLSAISQRGSKKDFIDFFALIKSGMDLSYCLALYRKRYAVEDTGHILYGLAYFDNADREKTPKMLWKVDWETIRESIRRWVKEYTEIA